jgi:hypothetical protein
VPGIVSASARLAVATVLGLTCEWRTTAAGRAALHLRATFVSVAAAGKKLRGHGARHRGSGPSATAADGGYPRPPHPMRVHAGQKFVARRRGRHRALLVCSAPAGGRVDARVEISGQLLHLASDRLLAARADGQGRYFQFLGWATRRYRTWATVTELDTTDSFAVLVLPEWHPTRRVRFPLRLVPSSAQRVGEWLRVVADLSAANPGKLNLAELSRCAPPEVLLRPSEGGLG